MQTRAKDNEVYYKLKFSKTNNIIIIGRHPKYSIFIHACLTCQKDINSLYSKNKKKTLIILNKKNKVGKLLPSNRKKKTLEKLNNIK
jgi:hypothetical protein